MPVAASQLCVVMSLRPRAPPNVAFPSQKVLCGRLKHVLQVGHFLRDDGTVKMLVKLRSGKRSSPENNCVITDRSFLATIDLLVQMCYSRIRPLGPLAAYAQFLHVPEHLNLGNAFVKVTVSTTDYELRDSAYGDPCLIPGPLYSEGPGLYVQFQLVRQTRIGEPWLMLEPEYYEGPITRLRVSNRAVHEPNA